MEKKKKMSLWKILTILGVLLAASGAIFYHLYNINYSKRIIDAFEEKDYAKAEKIIKQPGNVNYTNGLVLFNIFIDHPTTNPMRYACVNGLDVSIVRALLDNGGKTDAQGFFGYSRLNEVLSPWHDNDYEVAKLLLERGANPNPKLRTSEHPLALAARGRGESDEVVQEGYKTYLLLKSYGSKCDQMFIPLNRAALFNNYLIVEDILANETLTPDEISGALISAAHDNNKESILLLLNAGADKTYMDENGRTALYYAQWSGYEEIIALLS